MTWTLLIFVFIVNGAADGGALSQLAVPGFNSEDSCVVAMTTYSEALADADKMNQPKHVVMRMHCVSMGMK